MKNIFLLAALSLFLVSCGTMQYKKIKYSKVNDEISSVSKENKIDFLPKSNLLIYNEDSEPSDLASTEDKFILAEKVDESISDLQSGCDKILLKSGNEVLTKVLEIGTQEIKYKKCDNLEGPTISILKKDVFMITYANGTKDVFQEENNQSSFDSTNNNTTNNTSSTPKVNGFAVTSLILGILGFIPLLGMIFGMIALGQINSDPDKYRGKGMAVAGVALSVFWIVILVVFVL
jgi:hypothetical protein